MGNREVALATKDAIGGGENEDFFREVFKQVTNER